MRLCRRRREDKERGGVQNRAEGPDYNAGAGRGKERKIHWGSEERTSFLSLAGLLLARQCLKKHQ